MKKLYSLFVALCTLATLSLSAQTIAPRQALERAATMAKTSVMKSQAMADYRLAKTIEVAGEPAMYLYLPASGEGFLLVAAEEGARAVLGVSDKGRIDVANLPAPLQSWIDVYAREIAAKRAAGANGVIRHESRATIAPICKTQWGMDEPFNYSCPTTNIANVPSLVVAAAQVMKVHEWPVTASGSASYDLNTKATGWETVSIEQDFSTYSIAWADMKDVYTGKESDKENYAVSDLMAALGVAMHARYDTSSSGSSAANNMAAYALIKNFGYDRAAHLANRAYYTAAEWEQLVYGQLAAGQPVIYGGYTTPASSRTHAMGCDGYENGLYHFNCGWEGLGDAYFPLNAVMPEEGETEWRVEGFTYDQYMVYNIKPDREGTSTAFTQQFTTTSFALVAEGTSMKVVGSFRNNSLSPVAATLGLGLYANGADEAADYREGLVLSEEEADSTVNEYAVSLKGVADGTYEVRPVIRYGEQWERVRVNAKSDAFLTVRIEGGAITVEEPVTLNPIGAVLSCKNALFCGNVEANVLKIRVYNPSASKEYSGYVAGYFVEDDGETVYASPSGNIEVRVGIQEARELTYYEKFIIAGGEGGESTGGDTKVDGRNCKFRLATCTKFYERLDWISEPITLWIGNEGDPTAPEGLYDGIVTVNGNARTSRWFDIQGRQVSQPAAGLYINAEGRKVVIK